MSLNETLVRKKLSEYLRQEKTLRDPSTGFAELTARFSPMVQRPRKVERNELIEKYQTELSLDYDKIYDAIAAEHPQLLMKGKGNNAKPVQLATMIKEFERWKKSRASRSTGE